MERLRKLLCTRPRFEIRQIDTNGNETIEIFKVQELAEQHGNVTMERRGFFKLAIFAQLATAVCLKVSRSNAAEELGKYASIPKEKVRTAIGKIASVDSVNRVICIKQEGDPEDVCINLTPDTSISVRGATKGVGDLKPGDLVVVRYVIGNFEEKTAISIEAGPTLITRSALKPAPKPEPVRSRPRHDDCNTRTGRCS